ncbi:MAG TPA: alpha/beta hydrolase [Streptosporangiaceae bacterium]
MRTHELILLHGQPGSGADWEQVQARLPAGIRSHALDRPGYGSSRQPGGGFTRNARAVLAAMDARGIPQAVLVGHSYGGGVALAVADLAPHRVRALVLLASVGPGCLNGADRLLAAPVAGPLCALVAWRLTPWFARGWLAGLARVSALSGHGPVDPDQHVNWHVWGNSGSEHTPLWRTFLAEQRALVREADGLATRPVRAPALLLADPRDTLVPVVTARRLARDMPDATLRLVEGPGHHLPRRAPGVVADAITGFLASLDAR